MAEYKTFNISLVTTLENGKGTAKVFFEDFDSGYTDERSYELNIDELDKLGGEYIDSVSEFLLDRAKECLIENKKKYRAEIINVYDDLSS